MGQYHYVVNIDKRQYLDPHDFTDGIKLLEWGSGGLTGTALAVLLACSNGRGGGDLRSESPLVGSWAGDRIAVIGDYWEAEESQETGLPEWTEIQESYTNIGAEMLPVLCEDGYLRSDLLRSVAMYDFGRDFSAIFTEQELTTAREQLEREREAALRENEARRASNLRIEGPR